MLLMGWGFAVIPDAQAACPAPRRAWLRFDASWDAPARTEWVRKFARNCNAVVDRQGDFLLVEYPATEPLPEIPGIRVYPLADAPSPPPAIPWSQVGAQLVDLQQAHPDVVRLHVLGKSIRGRPVFAVEISDAPGNAAFRPVVRITGAHHGDETVSTDIALGIAAALAAPEAADLRARFSFWVVPVVNPDGYAARSRANDAGADLNRDYGFFWDEEAAPFSQPETRIQWNLARNFPPFLSLDYHSAAEYVNTVYDGSSVRPPDIGVILELGEVYAGPARLDVIVGYDWYAAYGSCQDYHYGTQGALAYTIETLQPSNTSAVVAQNVQALRAFLEHAQENAVCGTVTDAQGRPLPARIQAGAFQPFFTSSAGVFCHIPDSDPVVWSVEAPLHQPATFSTPRQPDAPVHFELAPSTQAFGAFAVAAMGNLGTAADTVNPAHQALGLPDGRFFRLGRAGFVVLDFGLLLKDTPGAEASVAFDPGAQNARVRAAVSRLPWGPFSACGDFTGDFDLDLGTCAAATARYLHLENLVAAQPAALDGLRILPNAVDGADADADGIPAWQDCDDSRPDVGAGFEERCDGIDNDCNGLVDEGFPVSANGVVECEPADAGPDADTPDDADADADADAGPDADVPEPKKADGVSCACRHPAGGNHPGLLLAWLLATALLAARKRLRKAHLP